MADENVLVRLTKLMGMSTSSNDGEALTALRMANRELANLGKSWDDLLKGKITIIADPFQNLSAPPPREARSTPPPPMARPKASPIDPTYQPRPRPSKSPNYGNYTPPPPPPPPPAKDRQNFYGGPCVACSNYVGAKQGFIKKSLLRGWDVYCDPCFKSNAKPAPKTATSGIGTLA